MVRVQKLHQPNRHSGDKLAPGKSLEIRGIAVKNNNKFDVYVDAFNRKPWKPSGKTKKKSAGKENMAEKIVKAVKKLKKESKSDAASL